MILELTPSQRRALRARAHGLRPTVIVGEAGLSPAILAEVNRAVASHELVKVKVAGAGREEREAMLLQICDALGAAPVQHIGRILVIFRENPEATGAGPGARQLPMAPPASRGRRRTAAASRPLKRPPSRGG